MGRKLRVSAVIFSHLDDDHIAGGRQFIQEFLTGGGSIRYVYIDADRDIDKRAPGSKTAKDLVRAVCDLAKAGKVDLLAPRFDVAEVDRDGHDWHARMIGPRQEVVLDAASGALTDEPNVHSAVLKVEFGGKSVTIGGDAPLASWAAMRSADVPATAFRIPHHGGALDDGGDTIGWTAQHLYDLYDRVGPKIGVISVGTSNQHQHPRSEWVAPLLSRAGCSTVCTQLTPRCEPRVAGELGASHYRKAFLPHAQAAAVAWRHNPDPVRRSRPRREVPCAGSVALVLHENGRLERFPGPKSGHATHTLPQIKGRWCR